MRGEISTGTFAKRHPLDWYCEEEWVTYQLFKALGGFADDKAAGLSIYDPAAGYGRTAVTFHAHGFRTFLSDVVCNVDWATFEATGNRQRPLFRNEDFLLIEQAPMPCSIVCNPPYSYIKGIAEAFARHALKLASGRVCMLLPNKWLSSQARFDLFIIEHPPQAVLHLTQRPSMPPGDCIHLMGKRAFRGGMIDYCWIVWDVRKPTAPGETRTIWLPPLSRMDETYSGLGAASDGGLV